MVGVQHVTCGKAGPEKREKEGGKPKEEKKKGKINALASRY